MNDEAPQLMIDTLEARRALIREARIDGYLQAADDLEDHGPAAVRAEAKRLREGYYRDDS